MPESTSDLAISGIKHITQFAKVAVDLNSAVYMFHFSQALIKHVSDKEAYNVHVGEFRKLSFSSSTILTICPLVPLCKGFLSRKWYAFDGREMAGSESNSLLEQLLKGYFKDAKFSFIRSNLNWVETEISDLKARGGVLPTFPCIKM